MRRVLGISQVWWLLGIYVVLTLVTLIVWDARGVYGSPVTSRTNW